jgi:hypothetical protein
MQDAYALRWRICSAPGSGGTRGSRVTPDIASAETNAATALEAAARLLLALGVTPDVEPGDPSEGARRIRALMSAGLVGRDAGC